MCISYLFPVASCTAVLFDVGRWQVVSTALMVAMRPLLVKSFASVLFRESICEESVTAHLAHRHRLAGHMHRAHDPLSVTDPSATQEPRRLERLRVRRFELLQCFSMADLLTALDSQAVTELLDRSREIAEIGDGIWPSRGLTTG